MRVRLHSYLAVVLGFALGGATVLGLARLGLSAGTSVVTGGLLVGGLVVVALGHANSGR